MKCVFFFSLSLLLVTDLFGFVILFFLSSFPLCSFYIFIFFFFIIQCSLSLPPCQALFITTHVSSPVSSVSPLYFHFSCRHYICPFSFLISLILIVAVFLCLFLFPSFIFQFLPLPSSFYLRLRIYLIHHLPFLFSVPLTVFSLCFIFL